MKDKIKIIQAAMMTNNVSLAKTLKDIFAEYDEIIEKIEHYESLLEDEKEHYYEQFLELYNSKKRIENDIDWLLRINKK